MLLCPYWIMDGKIHTHLGDCLGMDHTQSALEGLTVSTVSEITLENARLLLGVLGACISHSLSPVLAEVVWWFRMGCSQLYFAEGLQVVACLCPHLLDPVASRRCWHSVFFTATCEGLIQQLSSFEKMDGFYIEARKIEDSSPHFPTYEDLV